MTMAAMRAPSATAVASRTSEFSRNQLVNSRAVVSRDRRPVRSGSLVVRAGDKPASDKVKIEFEIKQKLRYGEQLVVCGNSDKMGRWKPNDGVHLKWSDGDVWKGSVEVPAGGYVEYKIAIKKKHGQPAYWEKRHNRIVQLYEGGATIVAKGAFGRDVDLKRKDDKMDKNVKVAFNIHQKIMYGHEVCIVGSAKEFGGWDNERALPLKWSEGDVWKGEVEMTPGGVAEYKMFTRRIRTGGEIKQEFRRNFKRMVQLHSSGSTVQVTGEFKGLVDIRLKGAPAYKPEAKKEEKKEEKKVEAKKEEPKNEEKKEEKKVEAKKEEPKKEEKKEEPKKSSGDKFTALAQGVKEVKKEEKEEEKKDVKASAIFDFGAAAKEADKKVEKKEEPKKEEKKVEAKKEEKSGDKFTSAVSKWGALKGGADAKDEPKKEEKKVEAKKEEPKKEEKKKEKKDDKPKLPDPAKLAEAAAKADAAAKAASKAVEKAMTTPPGGAEKDVEDMLQSFRDSFAKSRGSSPPPPPPPPASTTPAAGGGSKWGALKAGASPGKTAVPPPPVPTGKPPVPSPSAPRAYAPPPPPKPAPPAAPARPKMDAPAPAPAKSGGSKWGALKSGAESGGVNKEESMNAVARMKAKKVESSGGGSSSDDLDVVAPGGDSFTARIKAAQEAKSGGAR